MDQRGVGGSVATQSTPGWVRGSRGLARPRLHHRLEEVWEHGFGLVVAPAGCGKTTLLGQFATASEVPLAWYRVRRSDISAPALLAGLELAVTGTIGPRRPCRWSTVQDVRRALESWPGQRLLVVVDDIHLLSGSPAEETFGQLVEEAIPTLALLAAGRGAPNLDLIRRRVAGTVVELDSEDLRFRSWEVEELFRDVYAEPLRPEDTAALARRTGGWAAGLQLFHLATRGNGPIERRRFLSGLASQARWVAEYLTAEVLGALSDELRDFLVGSCPLGRLTGPICDQFTGRSGSEELLAELERHQVFTTVVEGDGAYRYHEVLRSYLEGMLLKEIGELELGARYRTAGRLLLAHGALPEAVEAFCRGGSWSEAQRLLKQEGQLVADVCSWSGSLPASLSDEDPWMLLAQARRALSAGRWREAMGNYERGERADGRGPVGDRCRKERRVLAAWLEAGPATTNDWTGLARAATEAHPAEISRRAQGIPGATGRFVEGLAMALAGRPQAARRLLEEASDTAGAAPLLALAARLLAALSSVLDGCGRVRAGTLEALAEQADLLGAPALTRLCRAGLAVSDRADGTEVAAAARAACRLDGDVWGAALTALLEGYGRLRAGRVDFEVFAEAATGFHGLGAGVLEAWARAGLAIGLSTQGLPEARDHAIEAEALARLVGASGAQALAGLALARTGGPKAAEQRANARAIATECGLSGLEGLGYRGRAAEIRCFGGLAVVVGGQALDLSPIRPRARSVLRFLALHAPAAVHREVLQEALWPEVDAGSGAHKLHVAVSSLRQALDPHLDGADQFLVARDGDTYSLVLPPNAFLDVATFEQSVSEAKAALAMGDVDRATTALAQALDAYGPDLFPEEGPAEWVIGPRQRLQAMAAEAALELGALKLAGGDGQGAAASCRKGLLADRYRDELWRQLIRACEQAGDPAAANRARMDYDEVLTDLGLEPAALATDGPQRTRRSCVTARHDGRDGRRARPFPTSG